jgi:hypothetical protein
MKSISLDNTNENRDSRKSPKQNFDEEGADKESLYRDVESPAATPQVKFNPIAGVG